MSKRALVTGGTGFVGANLARRLLRDGHEVHLLLRPGYADWRIQEIEEDLRLHTLDLRDMVSVAKTISKIQADWIFHLAAHGAYSWQNDVHQIFDTNVGMTVNLLETCLSIGFEAFVHAGSSSEYGFKNVAPSEAESLEPNSHYACAKAAATLYCRHASLARDAHVVTLRLYSAFGPFEDSKRLMPRLIQYGLRGAFPPLVNPNTARDFIYVEDVCEACVLVAETPGERGTIYNLGTGVQTTLRQVIETVRRTFGIAADPEWGSMPARSWDTSSWVAEIGKIRRELCWSPVFSFEQGFQEMIRAHASSMVSMR